ncbi:MAG: TonB-dependent receptor, partial [Gammaproteobacteria bacterium]|nr:TonB-dependent receptor [Gemmatimonadota bacterium]NIR40126.1 TonB-dependent receptor [Actinomycetota bacterium]NIU78245.1 TonB-dependent receptor [Gammaproteobacteria bacterium]NIY11603.1 TonB-dependent receptor [Gemmatimonadota bacterium]
LLDGAPLFNPYHLGGLFSAIDPDAIATLEVMPGGMPASEGDRASGVVKVWTRDGGRDRLRGHGALGLVSSRLGVDGPLPTGSGSYLVSARRTYFDLMTKGAYELGWIETPFPYSFTDAHAKITQDVGSTGRLNVSGYINDERVHTPREIEPNDRTTFSWGTRAGSMAYRQPLGGSVLANVTLAGTSFDGSFDAVQLYHAPGGGLVADTSLYGRITMRDWIADASLTWYGRRHRLRGGLQLDDYGFRYRFRVEDEVVTDPGDVDAGDADEVDDLFATLGRTAGITTIAAYLEDEWDLGNRLSLRLGIRALHAAELGTEWMPRAGARYALSDRLSLTLAAGRYAQAIHSLRDEESALASIVPYELLVPAAGSTGFLVAEDITAGFEYRVPDTRLRVDGYYKRYP